MKQMRIFRLTSAVALMVCAGSVWAGRAPITPRKADPYMGAIVIDGIIEAVPLV